MTITTTTMIPTPPITMGPVTHADGAVDLRADTGPVKDRLGQDRARQHATEVDTNIGNDGDECILKRMLNE